MMMISTIVVYDDGGEQNIFFFTISSLEMIRFSYQSTSHKKWLLLSLWLHPGIHLSISGDREKQTVFFIKYNNALLLLSLVSNFEFLTKQ